MHRATGRANQIDKVQRALVIGDHHIGAFHPADLIAEHLSSEHKGRQRPSCCLRHTVAKQIRSTILHKATPPLHNFLTVYHTPMANAKQISRPAQFHIPKTQGKLFKDLSILFHIQLGIGG